MYCTGNYNKVNYTIVQSENKFNVKHFYFVNYLIWSEIITILNINNYWKIQQLKITIRYMTKNDSSNTR